MEENILESIKDLLGINEEDKAFDNDVLVNINAAFSTLYQVGVGSEDHYVVLNGTETWNEVIEEEDLIDFIKLYIYMKVKIIFDPPTNASVLQAFTEQMKELEYRILLQADPTDYFNIGNLRCGHKVLTEKELQGIWKEIMGKDGNIEDPDADSDTLTNEEIQQMWNEIIYEKGGD